MKIAIKFGDNDFGNIFLSIMQMLLALKHNGSLPLDKDKLCHIIQRFAHVTYKKQWEHDRLNFIKTEDNKEFRLKYLLSKISVDRILVNDEVDAYIEGDNFFNVESIILDTEQHNIYFL